jgi:hypothetical protein
MHALNVQESTQAHTHAHTNACTYAHTNARTHARTHTRTCARTNARTHARTHARNKHARTHTRTHARTHAHTHTRNFEASMPAHTHALTHTRTHATTQRGGRPTRAKPLRMTVTCSAGHQSGWVTRDVRAQDGRAPEERSAMRPIRWRRIYNGQAACGRRCRLVKRGKKGGGGREAGCMHKPHAASVAPFARLKRLSGSNSKYG